MSNNLADRTHCRNGHEFTPDNTSLRKDGGRACKTCKREARARQLATPEARALHRAKDKLAKQQQRANMKRELSRTVNAEYKRRQRARLKALKYIPLPVSTVEDSLTKKNPLDYLKLNDEQAKRSDELGFAIDRVKSRLPCEADPDVWAFDPDEEPVPAEVADEMCSTCDVKEQCLAYALSLMSKQVSGVWGGRSFVYGEEIA